MDATTLIAILSPYLNMVINKGLDTLSEEGAKSLWEFLKSPFIKQEEKLVIDQFETMPNENKDKMAALINKKANEDAHYGQTINQLVESIKSNSIVSVYQHGAKNNVSIVNNIGNLNIS